MLWVRFSIGLFCILIGGTWFLQGINVVGGSFMSGEFFWSIMGTIVVIIGIFLIVSGLRQKPTSTE